MFATTFRNLIQNTYTYMAVPIVGILLERKANFISLQYGWLHYGISVPDNLAASPDVTPSPALLFIFPIKTIATSSLARCAKTLKKQGPVTHDLAIFIFVIEINLVVLGP